jgi:hypothetical protein
MKNVFRIMLIAAVATLFALPAYAQDAAAAQTTPALTPAQEEEKAKLYAQFLELIKGDAEKQRQASVAGKEYLTKYGTPEDDIVKYIKNWVSKYDLAVREFEFNKTLTDKNYARTFEMGRQMMSDNPDNVTLALTLSRAGLGNAVAGPQANKGLNPDALRFTRTAIQLVESGKAPAKWDPFTGRDDALGWLYYTQGLLTWESSPDEAVTSLLKAAQTNSTANKEPATFFHLGNAYVNGEYKKAVNAYKAAFPDGVEVTEDRKPQYDQLIGQVNGSLDRIIDAYARAVALSTKPEQAKFKADLTTQLATYHKARFENSTAADVQTLISNVLSRPLPQPGQPAAPETPAAAATTPAAANTATPTTTPAATNGAKPAATPASTTTPTKPRS